MTETVAPVISRHEKSFVRGDMQGQDSSFVRMTEIVHVVISRYEKSFQANGSANRIPPLTERQSGFLLRRNDNLRRNDKNIQRSNMAALIKLRTFILLPLFFTCTITKKIAETHIGFTPLHNYLLNPDVSFPDTVNHIFIGNATDFRKMFYMTKASPGTAVVPDFALQSVVAVVLNPTEKVVSVDINKAAITGNQLNVFYTITDTTSWKSYLHTPVAIAIVPKSMSVKQVSFYSNGIKEKTIAATY